MAATPVPSTPSQLASQANAASAAADPMVDPKVRKQVDAARGVAYHLLKGMKTIGFYRHAEAKFTEFVTKAFDALTAYLEEYGQLQLKVELTNFTLFKQDLFTEDSAMPFKFYKDGIRQLVFRKEFTIEELVSFTLIALSDPDRGAEDINAQLWRAQMPHFEYIMVEGFRMDEFSEEEVQVEVDKVVDILQRRLRTHSDDYLRFARVNEEDLEMKLDNIEQMRGVVITGITADPTLKAKLQKDVHEEENQRLFPKLISAVFQVVESGVDDAELLSDMFTQLLDAMLIQEDFAIINQVVLKLRAMEQRQGADSAVGRLLRNFVAKMGEEQRLNRLGDVLKLKLKSPQDVSRYLTTLTPDTVTMLLDVLEVVELPDNRMLLNETLLTFAKTNPDPFVNRLNNTEKPQVQRDMVFILDRTNHPDKLKFFASMLKSRNLALKLEVMGIIARGRSGEARKMISSLLDDETMQVRLQAARVLPEFDREKAFVDLMKLVKEPRFEKRAPEEREAMYSAIGSTGMPGAVTYFTQLLQAKGGLFNKQKVIEDKVLAIAGLGGACTIQTAKLLTEIADDKTQPTEVTQAARQHLSRVRKALFGSTPQET